jgi:hypothetical protein
MNTSRLSLLGLTVAVAAVLAGCSDNDGGRNQDLAPTISTIAGSTVNEDTVVGPLTFTVSDQETAAGSLTVNAVSSNTAVVAANGIVFGGSGGSRTITVTPVADAVGSATIVVGVTDGSGQRATSSFTLTFNEVRVGFTAFSRQTFALGVNAPPAVVDRVKFNFENNDTLVTASPYADLIP